MGEITLTIDQLQELLEAQKDVTSDFITRNMSVYHWYHKAGTNAETGREELKYEVSHSGYPQEFLILKKYIK